MINKMKKNITNKSGFTLIELMVTILIASFVFLGVAMVLADSVRGFKQMQTRVHGAIVNDAYFARLRFDSVCRKASKVYGHIVYDAATPQEVTVFWYSDNINPEALGLNKYAKFYLSGTNFMLDQGPATYNSTDESVTASATVDSTMTVAANVTELKFSVDGTSVQMTLTLFDNNLQQGLTVVCSSIRHN